ncbi:hypothetical protein AVEN_21946-1, partial [Araneus ventricosus]
HFGIPGNEMADQAATVLLQYDVPYYDIPIHVDMSGAVQPNIALAPLNPTIQSLPM